MDDQGSKQIDVLSDILGRETLNISNVKRAFSILHFSYMLSFFLSRALQSLSPFDLRSSSMALFGRVRKSGARKGVAFCHSGSWASEVSFVSVVFNQSSSGAGSHAASGRLSIPPCFPVTFRFPPCTPILLEELSLTSILFPLVPSSLSWLSQIE